MKALVEYKPINNRYNNGPVNFELGDKCIIEGFANGLPIVVNLRTKEILPVMIDTCRVIKWVDKDEANKMLGTI